jgi:hypothetical protein
MTIDAPWRCAVHSWRQGSGPEGSWVEVVVDPDYLDDDAWGSDFERHLDAVAGLTVPGVAPGRAISRGIYRFRCRPVVPAVALGRARGIGDRAALELFLAFAPILAALSSAAHRHEVSLARNVGPLQLALDAEGQGHLVGVGIPPIEIWDWHDDPALVPSVATLRAAPPERIAGEPEDVSSDLYALALVAAELGRGAPLLPQTGDALVEAIRRGEAATAFTGPLHRALAGILAPWPDERPAPTAAIESVRNARDRAAGPSLAELAAPLVAAAWGIAPATAPTPPAAPEPEPAAPAHGALAEAESWARRAAEVGPNTAEARAAARAVERVHHALASLQAATDPARREEAQRALQRAVDAARIAAEAVRRRATAVPLERVARPSPPPPVPVAPRGLRRGTQRQGSLLEDWERLRRRP